MVEFGFQAEFPLNHLVHLSPEAITFGTDYRRGFTQIERLEKDKFGL